MRIGVLALLLLAGVAAAATGSTEGGDNNAGSGAAPKAPGTVIYQSTDANGNAVFSDQPPQSGPSKTVELNPTNAMPMAVPDQKSGKKKAPSGQAVFQDYRSLTITSPKDGATIRNPRKGIAVKVELTPEPLHPGDTLKVLDNGQALKGRVLNNPNRGAHTLQAQVLGKDGGVLIQSPSITIYVHRTSVSEQSNNKGSGSSSAVASFGSTAKAGDAAAVGGAAGLGSGASLGGTASIGKVASPALNSSSSQ